MNFDPISAAQPNASDSQPGYFSNGLLSKIIASDQQLARPTQDVLRRRWIKRMFLAEVAFVIGVLLLQLFPVIEASSSAAAVTPPAATAETIAPTATPASSATPIQTAVIVAAVATVELPQPTLVSTQASALLPAALPNTGQDSYHHVLLFVGSLLCIGGGLVLWRFAGVRRVDTSQIDSSLLFEPCSEDQGSGT